MHLAKNRLAASVVFIVAISVFSRPVRVGGRDRGSNLPVDLPPIVIGVSDVQSGPSEFLGQKLLQGSMAYFNLVNESGGVHGRKISIILKDDKYEPNPASFIPAFNGIGADFFKGNVRLRLWSYWRTSSTRRLRARPSMVLFDSTGRAAPKPAGESRSAAIW